MRVRLAAIVVAVALVAAAYELVRVRHAWIAAVTTADAHPSEPVYVAPAPDPELPPVPRTRVVLIDGLSAEVAHTLPAWRALCDRGTRLAVDVGFPTVSLPVQFALWSGQTQQQTGVVNNGDERPRAPPPRGIPGQIADSWAIAENHGFIVRSLGFARAEADPGDKLGNDAWAQAWQARAKEAVTSPASLVFVHVLRVDNAGHHFGGASPEYRTAAAEADALLGELVAAAPDARWFALSDHGHLPGGGHGGDELAVRQVEACIAGPGVARRAGGPIQMIDLAHALASSTGAHDIGGEPLAIALASPAQPAGELAQPSLPLALAGVCVALGLGLSGFGARRWWLAPWWLVVALAVQLALVGAPTLSTPMTYGRWPLALLEAWLPALPLAAAATYVALGRTTLARAVLAQLAFPLALVAAALTACSGWPTVFGADVAPVVPRFTAWASALCLLAACGAAAVALALLARSVRRASDPRARPVPPRSAS